MKHPHVFNRCHIADKPQRCSLAASEQWVLREGLLVWFIVQILQEDTNVRCNHRTSCGHNKHPKIQSCKLTCYGHQPMVHQGLWRMKLCQLLSYNGICETCWILYHKLTYRIRSRYRHPCAHYKALHAERYVYYTVHLFTNQTILQPFIYRRGNGQIQLTKTILSMFHFQIPYRFPLHPLASSS